MSLECCPDWRRRKDARLVLCVGGSGSQQLMRQSTFLKIRPSPLAQIGGASKKFPSSSQLTTKSSQPPAIAVVYAVMAPSQMASWRSAPNAEEQERRNVCTLFLVLTDVLFALAMPGSGLKLSQSQFAILNVGLTNAPFARNT